MIRTTLAEKSAFILKRKAELGLTGRDDVPLNAGKHRTESKRALLDTLEREARAPGWEPHFKANIR